MDYKEMTVEELETRKAEISVELDAEGADLDALENEVRSIKAELEARKEAEAKKAEIRAAVAGGAGETIEIIKEETREEDKMYAIDSVEYRDAWVKNLIGRDLETEERNSLAAAANVIPRMTVNAVWDKLVRDSKILNLVDVTEFPTYVRFPVVTTNNAATAQAIGTDISESSDVIGYVDLIPCEYVKLITVGADIDHMAVPAVHDWIVNNLSGQIRDAIASDVVVGSGSGELKGIAASVNASATYIPEPVTKNAILGVMGSLGENYQEGAVWIMSANMFYNKILPLTTLNDYIINDGFNFRLFGHEVILMSEALISSKETIFYGDPKAYKVNFFKRIEVKAFETATSTNLQFRGATLVDGELLDTSAFVRFAQS